jgi:hypothetical protein
MNCAQNQSDNQYWAHPARALTWEKKSEKERKKESTREKKSEKERKKESTLQRRKTKEEKQKRNEHIKEQK